MVRGTLRLLLAQAYADYHAMMALTEQLIQTSARAVTGGTQACMHPSTASCKLISRLLHVFHVAKARFLSLTQVEYQGQTIDLGQPFRRASMHDLVQEATGELAVGHVCKPVPPLSACDYAWSAAPASCLPCRPGLQAVQLGG